MTEEKSREVVYELTVSRRGCVKDKGKLVPNETRLNDLPEVPEYFRPFTGSYQSVALVANQRNGIQTQHGFLDYLYSPEPAGATKRGELSEEHEAILAKLDFNPVGPV